MILPDSPLLFFVQQCNKHRDGLESEQGEKARQTVKERDRGDFIVDTTWNLGLTQECKDLVQSE